MGRPGFNRWGLRGVTHWSIASSVTHFLTSEIWPNRDPLGEQGFESLRRAGLYIFPARIEELFQAAVRASSGVARGVLSSSAAALM